MPPSVANPGTPARAVRLRAPWRARVSVGSYSRSQITSHRPGGKLTAALAVTATVVGLGALTVSLGAGAHSAQAATTRGATVPFTEYEAESAATNGTVLGMDRTAGTLASEASGRKAVQLAGQGKYVQFTLAQPANAVTIHYAIPDSADGAGLTNQLSLYVNGTKTQDLTVTSRYSDFYGSYPFSNNPGDGKAHHFYDDVRTTFGSTLAAGSTVKVQVDSNDTAGSYTIDTADFETVGVANAMPAGYLDATGYGADPTGARDSTSAIQSAVNAGSSQGKGVWIPTGTFTVTGHIILNNVTVKGAGPWYTVLHGAGVGLYGNYAPNASSNVHVSDLAIFGEVTNRDDSAQVNGIGGALNSSSVDNVWIQHTKVGAWLDGPFDGLTLSRLRILDTTADGVNFHNGITHSTVTNSFLRNTGDDGLAMWAESNADANDSFTFNTVELPILANNIAIYGGHDNTVSDNIVSDTQNQGGGIHVGNRFNAVPLAGTTTIARNTLIRTGVLDSNWQFGVGAIWFWSSDSAMTGTINVTDSSILDSSYEAIQFIGSGVSNVSFSNVTIDGTGTFVLQLQTTGSASFTNVTATHVGNAGSYNCQGTGAFAINKISGDTGWDSTYCGPWPAPVYTYAGGGGTTTPPTTPPPTTTPPTTTPPTTTPPSSPSGNLALNRPVTDSGHSDVYVAGNAVDGNTSTYWEGANAFPQTLTTDLGSAQSLGRLVLDLPPSSAWGARTETLSVLGSTDNSTWTTLVASNAYGFDPATGNTVTVTLPANSTRYVRLAFTANSGWSAAQLSELEAYAGTTTTAPPPTTTPPPATGNVALYKTVTDTGHSQTYVAANTVDGDQNSYWESTNNAFPQSLTLDLGSSTATKRLVLDLPASWGARSETLSVLGSADNSSFATLVGSTAYSFDPASANKVTISLPANSSRYLRLTFTANSGWAAGQLSELEAYLS